MLTEPASAGSLSVGVLVDLFRHAAAGGHVRCWERIAEAAAAQPGLDLTIYFLGDEAGVEARAPNVRFVLRRPVLPTRSLRFLDRVADHTDLAPGQPGLARALRRHDVLHTTDTFAMARSARRAAQRFGIPLVHSLHTDATAYTRVYSEEVMRRILGTGRLGRLVCERLRAPERAAAGAERALRRHLVACRFTLGAAPEDPTRLGVAPARFAILRRGIAKQTFHPNRRDRDRLEQAFAIPTHRFVVLFVGRLDRGKSVMTLAHAARRLLDAGAPLHFVFAGEGSQRGEIRALLGPHATLAGAWPHEELPWIYAGADLFAFPSRIEIRPNVVLEAMASGLPVVLSASGGATRCLSAPGRDAVVLEQDDPAAWASAIDALYRDPGRRKALGDRARRSIESDTPSWREVVAADLLPVWRRVAHERAAQGAPCSPAAS